MIKTRTCLFAGKVNGKDKTVCVVEFAGRYEIYLSGRLWSINTSKEHALLEALQLYRNKIERCMKGIKNYKIFAETVDEFERLACKSISVYLTKQKVLKEVGNGQITEFEIVATGKNEVGEDVEMVAYCGALHSDCQDLAEKMLENQNRCFEQLKNRLEQSGFVIEEGEGEKPVLSDFLMNRFLVKA